MDLCVMSDIKQDILQIRNHVINVISQENCNLRVRVQTLEERVLNVEKRVEQNHRKSNLDWMVYLRVWDMMRWRQKL